MKLAKHLLLAAMAATCASAASAAVGDMAVGASFNYASKCNQAGLGLHYQLEVLPNVRVAPEFVYFFKNDRFSTSNVNINAQYVIRTYAGFNIYPYVGFTYQHWDYSYPDGLVDNKVKSDHCGANVGCGAEYTIADHFTFFTEWRYQIVNDYNQSVTTAGLRYNF